LIAAFYFIREAHATRSIHIDEQQLNKLIRLIDEGVCLAEEQLIVEEFLMLNEEMGGPTNVTGSAVSTDIPMKRLGKRFAKFKVGDEVFKRFANGKSKLKEWSDYLDMNVAEEKIIHDFAKNNPSGVIILHNGSGESKSIRFNRHGGGGAKRK